ncbi:hypothetical protein L195_g029029, partial [Trifolium pratense]
FHRKEGSKGQHDGDVHREGNLRQGGKEKGRDNGVPADTSREKEVVQPAVNGGHVSSYVGAVLNVEETHNVRVAKQNPTGSMIQWGGLRHSSIKEDASWAK